MDLQKQLTQAGDNWYILGALSVATIALGSWLVPRLPPFWAELWSNPIFKIVLVGLILGLRQLNPLVALVTPLAIMILTLVLTMIDGSFDITATESEVETDPYQLQYLNELQEEVKEEFEQHPPKKVFNPDDPEHSGWSRLALPNSDVSLYDLNPPYIRGGLPQEFEGSLTEGTQYGQLIKGNPQPKSPTPSMYSTVHGYPSPKCAQSTTRRTQVKKSQEWPGVPSAFQPNDVTRQPILRSDISRNQPSTYEES